MNRAAAVCIYVCCYTDKKVNRWAQKKHFLRRQACRREKSGGPKEMLTRLEDVDAALAQHARTAAVARLDDSASSERQLLV